MGHPNIAAMRDRVTLLKVVDSPGGASGFHSTPVYETIPITLRAQVVDKTQVIRGAGGEESIADKVALIYSPTHVINPLDKITFADGESPRILRVLGERDGRGQVKAYTVSFGNSRRTG